MKKAIAIVLTLAVLVLVVVFVSNSLNPAPKKNVYAISDAQREADKKAMQQGIDDANKLHEIEKLQKEAADLHKDAQGTLDSITQK